MFKRYAAARVSVFVSAVILIMAVSAAFSQNDQNFSLNTSPLPTPTGFVNDYVGVIDAATKQQLEQKIKNFRDTSNPPTELAVAIVKTTGDREIFDYSLAVARGWKIGSKEDDNPGALLFIAIDDRKSYTQVSRDLEDELPDALIVNLQRQYLVPAFRQGDYAKGVSDTIDAYIRTINERRGGVTASVSPTPKTTQRRDTNQGGMSIGCCFGLFILFILVMLLSSRGRGGGGGWGGGGGLGSALPWIIASTIANSGSGRSSSSGWGGGGGGWGGGGGGFGGFGGGGDFGGGGGGSSW